MDMGLDENRSDVIDIIFLYFLLNLDLNMNNVSHVR